MAKGFVTRRIGSEKEEGMCGVTLIIVAMRPAIYQDMESRVHSAGGP